MRDALVLLVAAGIAAWVIWRVTIGETISPPKWRPRRRPTRRIRFEDALEVTAVGFGTRLQAPEPIVSFVGDGIEEPHHRGWSLARLILTIAFVGATIAAAIGAVGWLIERAIANLANS